MTDMYTLQDAIRRDFKPALHQVADLVDDIMTDLMDNGIPPREASSTVAHILVRAAWIVMASGETPDPEKFISCAREWTEHINFKAYDEEKTE